MTTQGWDENEGKKDFTSSVTLENNHILFMKVSLGSTARLDCEVKDLGPTTISWR